MRFVHIMPGIKVNAGLGNVTTLVGLRPSGTRINFVGGTHIDCPDDIDEVATMLAERSHGDER